MRSSQIFSLHVKCGDSFEAAKESQPERGLLVRSGFPGAGSPAHPEDGPSHCILRKTASPVRGFPYPVFPDLTPGTFADTREPWWRVEKEKHQGGRRRPPLLCTTVRGLCASGLSWRWREALNWPPICSHVLRQTRGTGTQKRLPQLFPEPWMRHPPKDYVTKVSAGVPPSELIRSHSRAAKPGSSPHRFHPAPARRQACPLAGYTLRWTSQEDRRRQLARCPKACMGRGSCWRHQRQLLAEQWVRRVLLLLFLSYLMPEKDNFSAP
nr:uncharacterized protein LOC105474000 [Macaca nemestrina]